MTVVVVVVVVRAAVLVALFLYDDVRKGQTA